MFIKKQLVLNSTLVVLAIMIGMGMFWIVQAEEIDIDCPATDLETYYADIDGDGYGNLNDSVAACSHPTGYETNSLDCDDGNADINPEATEICDNIDNDCDTLIDEGLLVTYYFDGDSDDYGVNATTTQACTAPEGFADNDTDCDDTDPAINPGATEFCNGVDNDCDTVIDNNCVGTSTFYLDSDGDGFGDPANATTSLEQPDGYVSNNSDCDDADSAINPNAIEICDFIDNNCNGRIDEGLRQRFYLDADFDTYGDADSAVSDCTAPSGYVTDNQDCNDADAAINPGANEVCDGVDNDCDGTVDEGCAGPGTYYLDSDADGYGDPSEATTTDEMPAGYVDNNDDCNDADASINPGVDEICDFVDNNCDGTVDEGLRKRYYLDADNDSYGDPDNAVSDCTAPSGYVADNNDCNDDDSSINPGANEVCDDIDNNCDGSIDEGLNCDNDEDDDNCCNLCNCLTDCLNDCICDCDNDCDCDRDRDRDQYHYHYHDNNDAWDDDISFKNHGQWVSSMAHYTNFLKKSGQISGKEMGKMMKEAAKYKSKGKKK